MNNKIVLTTISKLSYFGIFFSLFMFSCAKKAQPIKTYLLIDTVKIKENEQENKGLIPKDSTIIEENPQISELEFNTFTSKSRVSFKNHQESISANLSVRIRKDSVIWFSVSEFGIEGVRGIITQDSIKMINKIDKTYYLYDFKTVSQKLGIDLNFTVFESLLIGNLPFRKANGKFRKQKDYYLFRQENEKITIDNYIGDKDKKLKRLLLQQQLIDSKLTMDFDDFIELNKTLLPHSNLITLDYQVQNQYYQTVVEIKHKKIELDLKNLSYPFSIPSKYSLKKE